MKNKGGPEVANDGHRLQTVVIDVLFSFNLAAILKKIYFLSAYTVQSLYLSVPLTELSATLSYAQFA